MDILDKKRIAANFSRAAKHYELHAVLQKAVTEQLLERLDLVQFNPKWILDAGSGSGLSARLLAKKYKNARIAQLDLANAMLLYSRRQSSSWFSRQCYVCADVESMPLATGKIDLVFSSLMLQWCNDLDRALVETKRILRPGGVFMFATLGPDTLKELRECWAVVDDIRHVNTFIDMHDIGDALIRAGMEGVVMDVERTAMQYQDCRQLMKEIKMLGANNANTSRPRGLTGRDKLHRVIEAYEGHRDQGRLPVTYEIIYGRALSPAGGKSRPAREEVKIPLSALQRPAKSR